MAASAAQCVRVPELHIKRMKPLLERLHLRGDRVRSGPRASGARNGRYSGGVGAHEEAQEHGGGAKAEHDALLLRRYRRGAGGQMKEGDGGLVSKAGAFVRKARLG